jgi:hypothetical protein
MILPVAQSTPTDGSPALTPYPELILSRSIWAWVGV